MCVKSLLSVFPDTSQTAEEYLILALKDVLHWKSRDRSPLTGLDAGLSAKALYNELLCMVYALKEPQERKETGIQREVILHSGQDI